MKISLALLVLLLAAAWAGRPGMSFRSSRVTCCSEKMFSLQKVHDPEIGIQKYKYTSPSCTHKAVLVTLKSGITTCVERSWFQKYLKKQKKAKSTSQ